MWQPTSTTITHTKYWMTSIQSVLGKSYWKKCKVNMCMCQRKGPLGDFDVKLAFLALFNSQFRTSEGDYHSDHWNDYLCTTMFPERNSFYFHKFH